MQKVYKHNFLLQLLTIICFTVSSIPTHAQTFQQVSHYGIAAVGNNVVNVSSTGTPNYNTSCSNGPYLIGYGGFNLDFKYTFFTPTTHVRFTIALAELGEQLHFKLNGQFYYLNAGNLSLPVLSCTCTDTAFSIDTGYLNAGNLPTSWGARGCVNIDIIAPHIDSIEIIHNGNDASNFSFFFLDDTAVYAHEPFNDTVLCQGQQFGLPYFTSGVFNANNTFSVQMSDASGSFASPTVVGTRADTTGDTIQCTIPLTTTAGTGYKFRIVSSSPVRTSYANNPDSIEIKPNVQGFSNSSNTPICASDTLQLNGTTTSTGVSWSWVGVGSFNSVAKDTFIANTTTAMSGDYVLTATLNSSGCSLKDTTTVLVKPLPAKPVASSNAPVCTGDTLRLTTSSSTSGVSYSWVGAGSYTSAMQNPTVSNNAVSTMSGNYISTVTLNGCSNKDTINVVVHPVTPAPTVSSNSPLCATQMLNLMASNITGASYNWFGVAGFTANTQYPTRPNMTSGFAGTYYVYATLNGCLSDTTAHIVQVNPDPQVNVIPSPSTSICAGQTATFVALTSNAGATPSFQWLVNGIATGQTGTSYITNTLLNNDAVRCVMTSTGTCSSSFIDTSSAITMTVTPVQTPSVTIAANPSTPLDPNEPVMFTATPTNGGNNPTYQWTRNGTPISGAIGQTWGANANALSNNDDICVIMYSDYACPNPDSAKSNCITVQINVGIDNVNNTNKLQLFPNPNKGTFTLQGETNGNKPIQLSIINSIGQTVYQSNIQPQNNTINQQIELNKELATGVYLLQLRSDEGVSTVRMKVE